MSFDLEQRLTKLWRAYRGACPDPEGSPDFMPGLWARIEAGQVPNWIEPLRWWATRLAAASALVAAVMVGSLRYLPPSDAEPISASYLYAVPADALAEYDGDLWLLAENGQ